VNNHSKSIKEETKNEIDIEREWNYLKNIIINTANENLGEMPKGNMAFKTTSVTSRCLCNIPDFTCSVTMICQLPSSRQTTSCSYCIVFLFPKENIHVKCG
jgi:hypothetical protein